MNFVLMLILIQAVLGAFDTLYHHEMTEALPGKKAATKELKIHGFRSLIYTVLFFVLAWFETRGIYGLLIILLLIVEILLTLWDFVVEDNTRKLPASERITHTILAINYGVILAFLVPILYQWTLQETAIKLTSYGYLSIIITLFSCGVLISAVKDLKRSYKITNTPAYMTFRNFEPYKTSKKRCLVAGGTGFIGKRLTQVLIYQGHDVILLVRNMSQAVMDIEGKITLIKNLQDIENNERIDVVINLAGEPLAKGRWTKKKKQQFIDSRITITKALNQLINRLDKKPGLFINGSAIGFYGPQGDDKLNEDALHVESFSHSLCLRWEQEALKAEQADVRVCLLRAGIVLGQDGGPLARLRLSFEFGVAMQIGDGKQWMSWIHRDDVIGSILFLMTDDSISGAVNITAPEPVTNAEFASSLGNIMKTFIRIRVPAVLLRLGVGEMAQELMITGQRVIPAKLSGSRFYFQYPILSEALDNLINHRGKSNNTTSVEMQ